MLIIRTRIRTRGPIFDRRAAQIFADYAEDLEEEGADWALDDIRSTFHSHFRQPTGFYESNVTTHRTATGMEVWDGGVAGPVYGPWLEGVGSRNNTTRFKGYHAFRNAASRLQQRIEGMGERLMNRNHIHRF